MTQSIEQLRVEAAKAGLYAIQESHNKWLCIRKTDACYLARGERSESIALQTGLVRTEFL
jgi:hypothetical protein